MSAIKVTKLEHSTDSLREPGKYNCQIFFYYFENTHQKRTYIVLFPYNNTSTYVKQYCEQLYPSNFGLFDVINEQFAVKIFIIKWLTE